MTAPPSSTPCPCGRRDARGLPSCLARCCGPYLSGTAVPPDAEALMRSRYTAYVLGDAAYLLDSWHPRTRPASLELEPGLRWLGLEVRRHRDTGPDRAEVEFVARSRPRSRPAVRLHEISRFRREGGRWFYVDGDLS